MSTNTVIISKTPLPYHKVGSWTNMYNFYLRDYEHLIDSIICPSPKEKVKSIDYYNYVIPVSRFQRKISFFNNGFKKALNSLLSSNESLIIQIIDDYNLAMDVSRYLNKLEQRSRCYIQFFYHGFAPNLSNAQGKIFFGKIDECILLTQSSYKSFKAFYTVRPCVFSILNNGVQSNIFFKLSEELKNKKRLELGIDEDKIVFLWCSMDRPKKGLDFIIKVWSLIHHQIENCELWIIGSNRIVTNKSKSIKSFGVLEHYKLATYYQVADFYLFPTLCKEGFGLSMLEALKCGCNIIASDEGSVSEILGNGRYGKLVNNANSIEEWIDAIKTSIKEYLNDGRKNKYADNKWESYGDILDWAYQMNSLILRAKKFI